MVTSTATQLICYPSAAPARGWLGSGNGLSAEANQIQLTICCDAMRRIVFFCFFHLVKQPLIWAAQFIDWLAAHLFLKIAYFHGYVSWILSPSFWGHNKTCILESVPVHPWLFGSWQLLNFTWKWGVSAFQSVEFYSVQLNNLSVVITAFSPWNWSVGNLTNTSYRFIKKRGFKGFGKFGVYPLQGCRPCNASLNVLLRPQVHLLFQNKPQTSTFTFSTQSDLKMWRSLLIIRPGFGSTATSHSFPK